MPAAQNKYESTTDKELMGLLQIRTAYILFSLTVWQHSTLLCERTWPPFWNYDVRSNIWLGQSMHIHVKNIRAKFCPDPIWNDGALGFFQEVSSTRSDTATLTIHSGAYTYNTSYIATLHLSHWIKNSVEHGSLVPDETCLPWDMLAWVLSEMQAPDDVECLSLPLCVFSRH